MHIVRGRQVLGRSWSSYGCLHNVRTTYAVGNWCKLVLHGTQRPAYHAADWATVKRSNAAHGSSHKSTNDATHKLANCSSFNATYCSANNAARMRTEFSAHLAAFGSTHFSTDYSTFPSTDITTFQSA